MVSIHYPAINNATAKTEYYRRQIRSFSLTDSDGIERWIAYRFIKNVYDIWVLTHFENICFVIDQLPAQPASENPGALPESRPSRWLETNYLSRSSDDLS